jgi:hypothetical protein
VQPLRYRNRADKSIVWSPGAPRYDALWTAMSAFQAIS